MRLRSRAEKPMFPYGRTAAGCGCLGADTNAQRGKPVTMEAMQTDAGFGWLSLWSGDY